MLKNLRVFLTCVFCFLLIACSDAPSPETSPHPDSEKNPQTIDVEHQATPLLSLPELLSADDVRQGLAKASAENDQQALIEWQKRLLLAADQVDLLPEERKFISGEQGLVFLQFQGMKTNYQAAFEEAFFNFADVEAVYEQYPAFKNMHEASRDIVEKRDDLVDAITATLIQEGMSEEEALEEARRQWMLMMQAPQVD
jgi:hypothetical protein